MQKIILINLFLSLTALLSFTIQAETFSRPFIETRIYSAVDVSLPSGNSLSITPDIWKFPDDFNEYRVVEEDPGADYGLCSGSELASVDSIMTQLNMNLRLNDLRFALIAQEAPRKLSKSDLTFLRSVPRCEPFLGSLNSIIRLVSEVGKGRDHLVMVKKAPQQFSHFELTLLKDQDLIRLSLILLNGQSIDFSRDDISFSLSPFLALYDKEFVSVSTGLKVKASVFKIEHFNQQENYYTESCEELRVREVCRERYNRRGEKIKICKERETWVEGVREIKEETYSSEILYKLDLVDGEDVILASFLVEEIDHDNDSIEEGECLIN